MIELVVDHQCNLTNPPGAGRGHKRKGCVGPSAVVAQLHAIHKHAGKEVHSHEFDVGLGASGAGVVGAIEDSGTNPLDTGFGDIKAGGDLSGVGSSDVRVAPRCYDACSRRIHHPKRPSAI